MKSYLGWPIQFSPFLKVPEAHLTFKYLGDAPVTSLELKNRLFGLPVQLVIDWRVSWKAEVFFKTARVMVLEGLDDSLWKTRDAIDDLRKDDFKWRPHITLPKEAWENVTQNNIPPWSVIRSIGPLTHFVDKMPAARFR